MIVEHKAHGEIVNEVNNKSNLLLNSNSNVSKLQVQCIRKRSSGCLQSNDIFTASSFYKTESLSFQEYFIHRMTCEFVNTNNVGE